MLFWSLIRFDISFSAILNRATPFFLTLSDFSVNLVMKLWLRCISSEVFRNVVFHDIIFLLDELINFDMFGKANLNKSFFTIFGPLFDKIVLRLHAILESLKLYCVSVPCTFSQWKSLILKIGEGPPAIARFLWKSDFLFESKWFFSGLKLKELFKLLFETILFLAFFSKSLIIGKFLSLYPIGLIIFQNYL